ncbi:MAG: amidohydrolase family protein, partial [Blastocatellia bacterium]
AMKYGGVGEEDALRMVTLNPAVQLGIDKRVGSIDVGKDADLVIFSQHPFSVYTVAEMTMIEGEVYFDRSEDLKQRDVLKREKADLIRRERDQRGGPRPPRADRPDEPQPRPNESPRPNGTAQ